MWLPRTAVRAQDRRAGEIVGPQFLLFGFGMSTTFDGKGAFNLQLGHRYPWLTQSGLEWRNDIVLGSTQAKWHTELRQPVLDRLGFYIAPYLEYGRKHVDIYPDSSPTRSTTPLTAVRGHGAGRRRPRVADRQAGRVPGRRELSAGPLLL
jgi:hypothetical protein